MKSKKTAVIMVGIALLIIAAIAILLVFLLPELSGSSMLNEYNTIEYDATVKNVEKTNDGYLIDVAEYDVKLKVESKILSSDVDLDSMLCEGYGISFRIAGPEFNLSDVHDVELVIAALVYERTEIISLSKSNELYMNSIKNMRIIVTVFAVLIIIAVVVLFVYFSIKSKKEDNANPSRNSHL